MCLLTTNYTLFLSCIYLIHNLSVKFIIESENRTAAVFWKLMSLRSHNLYWNLDERNVLTIDTEITVRKYSKTSHDREI